MLGWRAQTRKNIIPEEKGVIAIPRLMEPPYFLPRMNWRGTTMIGVGEDNTWPSITRVLDHLTGGEGVFFLEQTI